MGFKSNSRLSAAENIESSESDSLHFLFMHSGKSKDLIYKVTEAVRSSKGDSIRFMPIIVFVDVSFESEVQEFLDLGCDDIIIYPNDMDYISQRVALQIRTRQDYFETASYFGPDRRRDGADEGHDQRHDGMEMTFRHYVIKRSVSGNVKIVSSKLHTPEMERKAG